MHHRVMSIFLIASLIRAVPASAQIHLKPDTTKTANPNAFSALVANPYIVGADTVAAVAIGTRMRNHLVEIANRNDWTILTQLDMNNQLTAWKIGKDKILQPAQVLTFAIALNAVAYVSSELSKGKDGSWTLQARMVGRGNRGAAGHVFTVTQPAGPNAADLLGTKMADAMLPAFKAFPAAKKCFEGTDPVKQAAAAADALKILPNYGMANRCMADMAWEKDAISDEAIAKMKRVLVGDPLSLDTYDKLAKSYYARVQKTGKGEDSVNVIDTYRTMIRVAPNDGVLLFKAVQVFKAFHQPNAADTVVAQMLVADPGSKDALDLGSNACIAKETKEGFLCAMDYLEREFRIDSANADSNFYSKIIYTAMSIPDTAKFADWAQRGINKYPNNPEMIQRIGYVALWRKDYDGAVEQFKKIVAVKSDFESDDSKLLKISVNAYLEQGQLDKVLALFPMVKKTANDVLIEDFSNLVLGYSSAKYNAKDYGAAMASAEAYLSFKVGNVKNDNFAGYFLWWSALSKFGEAYNAIGADNKNCAKLVAASQLMGKIDAGMAAAGPYQQAAAEDAKKQLAPFREAVANWIKDAGCNH